LGPEIPSTGPGTVSVISWQYVFGWLVSEEELFWRVKSGADIEGEHPAKQKNAKSKYFRANNLANDETSTYGVVCATMGVGRSSPGGGGAIAYFSWGGQQW